jgi:hypothetical protein
MKVVTRVRTAAHLVAYMEELHGLRMFKTPELHLIQDALLLLIGQMQQDAANHQATLSWERVPALPAKIYQFQEGNYTPDRLIVCEDGQPARRLRHVPIFAYGFGLAGLAAFDTALAILADIFGEALSLTEFATGHHYYCHVYLAFAKEVISNPRSPGRFETAQIATFLRQEYRKKQREAGKSERVGVEKDNKRSSFNHSVRSPLKAPPLEKGKYDANKQATERSV